MAFQAPYYKPTLPFSGPIYGGLRDGMVVVVTGTVLHSCARFQIDFQCGSAQSPQPDIAFHFNSRFNEGNCVVCNSFERRNWQHEERKQEIPFRKGQSFEIRFLVKSHAFMVAVNGKHYLEFKHRIPFSRVDTIGVSAGLDVASISFQGCTTHAAFPPGFAHQQNPVFSPGVYFQPPTCPVPYQASIFGGFQPSRTVTISGTVPPCAIRFHLNLKVDGNVAFHLNPRFNEKVIVRNSKFGGAWGPEERHLPAQMPFVKGQAFTIQILCDLQCFRVAVNGQHQFDYKHRISDLQRINQLEIEGDVVLNFVQL